MACGTQDLDAPVGCVWLQEADKRSLGCHDSNRKTEAGDSDPFQ